MELCFNEMTVMKNGALPEDIALCAQAGFSAVELCKGTLLRYLFLPPYTQRPHERRRIERFFVSSYHIFPALPRVRQARYAFRAAKTYISGRLFAPAQMLWYALFCKIVGKQVASPRIFGIRTRRVFIS